MRNASAVLGLCALVLPAIAQDAPDEPAADAARRHALEVAGAFANDGYRLRDGFVGGEIEPGRPVFAEVNLFSGNEYWFVAAGAAPARKLAVSVLGAGGDPVDAQTYAEGSAAAAGIEPAHSGRHFVKIELIEGEKAPFCLVYSYK